MRYRKSGVENTMTKAVSHRNATSQEHVKLLGNPKLAILREPMYDTGAASVNKVRSFKIGRAISLHFFNKFNLYPRSCVFHVSAFLTPKPLLIA